MSFDPGHELAHYEIAESIGAGGMGEVYRARDTKLGRDVAIKVLPEEFARDKERLDRFEREARLLAQLNHANIATLHGMEEHDGQQFLVMELVEGETLAERITQGPLPVDEAIPLFVQIAEGLEAAHEKGIIHRDLKPPNIKIGPDGKPKILDFGLAKAFVGDDDATPDSSQSPTLTKGTALGAIMGTASYMSPAQARGKPIDKRTDIWAFGCCLYEALTARKAFDGESVGDIVGSVLRDEPDMSTLPGGTANLVRKCLKKDARERVRDIGDVRLELPETLTSRTETPAVRGRFRQVAAVFLFGLAAGAGLWSLASEPSMPNRDVRRASVNLREGERIWNGAIVGSSVQLSPDGSTLLYLGYRSGRHEIVLRDMADGTITVLNGTRGATIPFFSPDSQWVGFFVEGVLKKVDISGGIAVDVARVQGLPMGADWGDDGHMYFADFELGIHRVHEDGGDVDTLENTKGLRWPQLLPGDKRLLATRWTFDSSTSSLVVVDLTTGATRDVVMGAGMGQYVATGHFVFQRFKSIFAVPFDIETGETTGPEISMVDSRGAGFDANFSISNDGTLAYVPGVDTLSKLVWVERDGRVTESIGDDSEYLPFPRLSPDGDRIAVTIGATGTAPPDIWIYDVARGVANRWTFGPPVSVRALWSSDGRDLYWARGAGLFDIYVQSSAHTDGARQVTAGAYRIPTGVSSDGTAVLFRQIGEGQSWDIGLVRVDTTEAEPELILATEFGEHGAVLSPDDRYMAYVSDESGRDEIYVREFPGLDGKTRVSIDGGTEPLWSRDGAELFYRRGSSMMAVSVRAGPPLALQAPVQLFDDVRFQSGFVQGSPNTNYDVSLDARRFLMIQEPETGAGWRSRVELVLNWTEELKRLVPTN